MTDNDNKERLNVTGDGTSYELLIEDMLKSERQSVIEQIEKIDNVTGNGTRYDILTVSVIKPGIHQCNLTLVLSGLNTRHFVSVAFDIGDRLIYAYSEQITQKTVIQRLMCFFKRKVLPSQKEKITINYQALMVPTKKITLILNVRSVPLRKDSKTVGIESGTFSMIRR